MTKNAAVSKLLAWANEQVGYPEGPDNWNKYAEGFDAAFGWHIQNKPWCEIFVKRGFVDCFGNADAAKLMYETYGKFSAGCKVSSDYYKKAGAWSTTPQKGDQMFQIVNGGINHTGIVTVVGMGAFTAVCGNTSDKVCRLTFKNDDAKVAGFGRPKWSIFDAAPAPTPSPSPAPTPAPTPVVNTTYELPTLRRGMKSETVRAAQFLLNGRGYSCGKADADFGPATANAVARFQRSRGIAADSIISPATWAALLGVS